MSTPRSPKRSLAKCAGISRGRYDVRRRLVTCSDTARCAAAIALAVLIGSCRPRPNVTFHVAASAASATESIGARLPTASASGSPSTAASREPTVLHIGDSFVEAFLEQNLASRFSLAGCRYSVHSETATSTIDWAYKDQLGEWLEQRPALVLVTLGANELDLPAPETRGWAVERIAHRISAAGASCVWIAPLAWNGDTGMLRVIHNYSAHVYISIVAAS